MSGVAANPQAADSGALIPAVESGAWELEAVADPPERWDGWPEGIAAGLNEVGRRTGFAADGVLDALPPGPALAAFADGVWCDGLDRVGDDELVGVMRAWRRLSSWAAAGELAAVAELSRRRDAQVASGADPRLAEHVGDEIAAALTLTLRAAGNLLDFASGLASLPLTRSALAAGQIDRVKALVITGETAGLSPDHAAAVEASVIDRAPNQTSGQLRAAVRRAVLAVDPAAADRRREQARKDARVETWHEPSGTSALAGRDLPAADVLSADKHIDALAHRLKANGAEGSMDQLRARVYTSLLLGRSVDGLLRPAGPDGAADRRTGAADRQGGAASTGTSGVQGCRPPDTTTDVQDRRAPDTTDDWGAAAGSVNLTMPLSSWLGGGHAPEEVAGFGPMPAGDSRSIAALLARDPHARWCLTLTGSDGRPVAHGCARLQPGKTGDGHPTAMDRSGPGPGPGWALTVTLRPLAAGRCAHERESPSYRPPPALQHLIRARQRTCVFPGCRRPAARCDLDHTLAYDKGGRSCECNLAPLCRHHHRAKQTHGWHLEQPEPGVMIWSLPHGRRYRVAPDPYPGESDPARAGGPPG